MIQSVEMHVHPRNAEEKIFGYRLEEGDKVEKSDVWDGEKTWVTVGAFGHPVRGLSKIYVRPHGHK